MVAAQFLAALFLALFATPALAQQAQCLSQSTSHLEYTSAIYQRESELRELFAHLHTARLNPHTQKLMGGHTAEALNDAVQAYSGRVRIHSVRANTPSTIDIPAIREASDLGSRKIKLWLYQVWVKVDGQMTFKTIFAREELRLHNGALIPNSPSVAPAAQPYELFRRSLNRYHEELERKLLVEAMSGKYEASRGVVEYSTPGGKHHFKAYLTPPSIRELESARRARRLPDPSRVKFGTIFLDPHQGTGAQSVQGQTVH